MNRIVTHHVPASELSDKLRGTIPSEAMVTVTIQEEDKGPVSSGELLALVRKAQSRVKGEGETPEEAVARIRALRDEWDDE